jgi:GNAT superfamily N-acetyltransferase
VNGGGREWAIRTGDGSALSSEDASRLQLIESECEQLVAPALPRRSADELLGWMAHPPAGGRRVFWVSENTAGEPLGAAWLATEGDLPGRVTVLVRPEHRRQGVGTSLLAEVADLARDWAVPALLSSGDDDESLRFARSRGWVPGRSHVRQLFQLPIPYVPTAHEPGLTVEAWVGPAPQRRLESFALARNAINDSPADDDEDETWTAQRVRDVEVSVAARDTDEHVTVVVDGGDVIAFTTIRVSRTPGSVARTEDTAVVREFRRRGIATWLKREALQRLSQARPDVTRLTTTNESTNLGMLAVNRALGGQPVLTRTQVRLELPTQSR